MLAVLLIGSAQGDQHDPRLNGLFARLKSAPDAHAAHVIEEKIWTIWAQSGDPKVNALLEKGSEALLQHHFRKARKDFEQVVNEEPTFAEGWNKLATTDYLLGNLRLSMHEVQRTLSLEPRHFGALYGMGLIFRDRGDDAAALKAFEQVLKLDPFYPGTRAQIKQLRRKLYGQSI